MVAAAATGAAAAAAAAAGPEPDSALRWPASGAMPAALVALLLLLLVARSKIWRLLSARVAAWPLAGLRLAVAAGALALLPVADLGAYASQEAVVLALSGLLLPLPLKQHLAAQGGALLAALLRLPRLALLQAAVPHRGEQCRAFVSGARYALQAFVPGGILDVASHPQQLSTSCWMQHTWLAVVAGFLLPSASTLIRHWRAGAAWPGNELALVAAMEEAAAGRRRGSRRRRRTIAGSAEPASSDDGQSLSVAAPESAHEVLASTQDSPASTPSFRSGVSLSSVVSAGSGLSLHSSGSKSSGSGSGKSSSSGGKSSSSSPLSPRSAQQRWAMIQALRRHPEWLLQPTQSTRLQWLLLGVPLAAAVWLALEVAAQGY